MSGPLIGNCFTTQYLSLVTAFDLDVKFSIRSDLDVHLYIHEPGQLTLVESFDLFLMVKYVFWGRGGDLVINVLAFLVISVLIPMKPTVFLLKMPGLFLFLFIFVF